MQRDGELDHPEIGTEMTTRGGHPAHEFVADLVSKGRKSIRRQRPQVTRVADPLEQAHPTSLRALPEDGLFDEGHLPGQGQQP